MATTNSSKSSVVLDDYILLEKIGEGTYGVVYKGIHKETKEPVAVKKIRSDNDDEGLPATSIREISLLKELTPHPHIVGLTEVLLADQKLFLVFEYLPMDLKKYMEMIAHEKKQMSLKLVKEFMFQLIDAMLFCHCRRIIHRDLKPQNILVDPKKKVLKVADLGLGRAFGIPVRVFTHEVVTLWYRAPEILLGAKQYTYPVDAWSIGCIFAELVTGKPLFQGDSEIDQLFHIFRILKTPTEDIWQGCSKLPDWKSTFPTWKTYTLPDIVKRLESDGIEMLQDLLIYDPAKRMHMKNAVNHRYFDGFAIET